MPDIVVRHPDGSTATHSLAPDEELVVGRADAAPGRIQLDSQNVSRDHAKISADADGGLHVEDLGSSNGTLVNGRQAPQGEPMTLAEGDQITIDKFALTIGAQTPAAPDGTPQQKAGTGDADRDIPGDDKTPPPSPRRPPPPQRRRLRPPRARLTRPRVTLSWRE